MSQFRGSSLLIYILSAVLGCFFLFSAYTKTVPIEYFEYTLKSQLGFSELAAIIAARFFVGLEAGLGLLMLVNIFGRGKWVLKIAVALLIAFTVHLLILYFKLGNDVNCGCMGEDLYMPPLQSIAKNIGLMVLLVIVLKKAPVAHSKVQHWSAVAILVVLLALPFFLYPHQEKVLQLEKLYEDPSSADLPSQNLKQGKQFVCFLSLTCPHCIDAASKLTEIKKADSSLPIYVVFAGYTNDTVKADHLANFQKESGFDQIPYSFLAPKAFIELSGGAVPAMFWIDNKKIVRKIGVSDINLKELQLWLGRK